MKLIWCCVGLDVVSYVRKRHWRVAELFFLLTKRFEVFNPRADERF